MIKILAPYTIKVDPAMVAKCLHPRMIADLLMDAHVMHTMMGPGGSKLYICSKKPENNIAAGIEFDVINKFETIEGIKEI